MENHMTVEKANAWVDLITKLLAIAVIPCLIWMKSLEEDRVLLIERQAKQDAEITKLQNKLESTDSKVANLEGSLREIKVKIDLITSLLHDLKSSVAFSAKNNNQ
jgi:hypothetical protein